MRSSKIGHNLEMRLLIQDDGNDAVFSVEMFWRNKWQGWLVNFQWMREKRGLQQVLPLRFVFLMERREKREMTTSDLKANVEREHRLGVMKTGSERLGPTKKGQDLRNLDDEEGKQWLP